MNIKVTCPECGSDDIHEYWNVLTVGYICEWEVADDGLPQARDYASIRALEDISLSDDSQFTCNGCNVSLAVHELKVEAVDD
jgi:predicted RNA-binding Zn-ribbon protein involved in translation (DUF1610 family)